MDNLVKDWATLQTTLDPDDNWQFIVRMDRCLSWIEHAEHLFGTEGGDSDSSLIFHWIAVSALWSRPLDRDKYENERTLISTFVKNVVANEHKCPYLLSEFLRSEADKSIHAISRDEGLRKEWWERSPIPQHPPKQSDHECRRIQRSILNRNTEEPLVRILLRVYLARCQLVHGGARCQSCLNRDAIEACDRFLRGFLIRAICILIDGGWETYDWDGVWYPPPVSARGRRGTLRRPRRGGE